MLGAMAAAHVRVAWSSLLLGGAVLLAVAFVAMGVIASHPRHQQRVGRYMRRLPVLRTRRDRIAMWWATWTSEVRDAIGARRDRARVLAMSIAAAVRRRAAPWSCSVPRTCTPT